LENPVVEGKLSKWILNRMRVRGLDPTASGKEVERTCELAKEVERTCELAKEVERTCELAKEVERTCELAKEVTMPYTTQKLVNSRETNYLPKKNHVPVPYLFSQSIR